MNLQSFKSHFSEFRSRIIFLFLLYISFFSISYYFYEVIIKFLSLPLSELSNFKESLLYVMSIFEGFIVKFKTSAVVAFVFLYPFLIFQILAFLFPALKKHERRLFFFLVPSTFILAFCGFFFVYFKLLPLTIPILLSSSFVPSDIGFVLNFRDSVLYILQFLFISMIVYQFPIIILLLLHFKLFSRKSLFNSFRYILIFIFIFSAIFTPPDVISQLGLALPLILLFFFSYFISFVFKIGVP